MKNDLIEVSEKIKHICQHLLDMGATLEPLSHDRAVKSAEYEKQLALVSMEIRNFEKSVPATILAMVAKGRCSEQAVARDLAESKYRNTLKIIDINMAVLNGYQSINRHLKDTT